LKKGINRKHISFIIPRYLRIIKDLQELRFAPLVSLAKTFESWQEEILRMLRF